MLLPYIEQQNQVTPVSTGGQASAQPIKILLCPSRRTVAVGAKDDYAAARVDGWDMGENGWNSILQGQTHGALPRLQHDGCDQCTRTCRHYHAGPQVHEAIDYYNLGASE